jgi:ABC-2 type transport system permease protein
MTDITPGGLGLPSRDASRGARPDAPRGAAVGAPGAALLPRVERPGRPSALSDALTFGWRAVLKFRHVPEQLFDLVMTPVMFTLLFTFVFGGALAGSPREYLQFFLPGILAQTVIFNSVYSGVGLCTDLQKGLFDRFRSLPIWSLAPFAGLMVGDVLRHGIAGGIILAIGLLLGYRPEAGVPGVAGAFLLLWAVGFGVGWVFMVIGLLVTTPMTVMTFGFTFIFPLVFASNMMVDPATMPGWLGAFVAVNPVSHVVTALRGLLGGTATWGQVGLALLGPGLLTLALAPVVLLLYRRR